MKNFSMLKGISLANTNTLRDFNFLKGADASGTLATYGHCATKSLGNPLFGFRGSLITTVDSVPVDFAIASADIDDREVLPVLSTG